MAVHVWLCVYGCLRAALTNHSMQALPCSEEVAAALRAPSPHNDSMLREFVLGLYAGRRGLSHAPQALTDVLRAVLCLPTEQPGTVPLWRARQRGSRCRAVSATV